MHSPFSTTPSTPFANPHYSFDFSNVVPGTPQLLGVTTHHKGPTADSTSVAVPYYAFSTPSARNNNHENYDQMSLQNPVIPITRLQRNQLIVRGLSRSNDVRSGAPIIPISSSQCSNIAESPVACVPSLSFSINNTNVSEVKRRKSPIISVCLLSPVPIHSIVYETIKSSASAPFYNSGSKSIGLSSFCFYFDLGSNCLWRLSSSNKPG